MRENHKQMKGEIYSEMESDQGEHETLEILKARMRIQTREFGVTWTK